MEQKRFGVKISLLNELRLFQSALLKRRRMFYDIDLTGYNGIPIGMRITTGENRVFIPGFTPFSVRRENYIERSPTTVSIVIIPHIAEVSIKFDSAQEKLAFTRDISLDWTASNVTDE